MASMLSNLRGTCGCGPIVTSGPNIGSGHFSGKGKSAKSNGRNRNRSIKSKPRGHTNICW
jgi:hypothetical protein